MAEVLWLGLYFPDLPLEVYSRGQQAARPLVVSEPRAGRVCVLRCNAPALACGIRPAMPLAAALALQSDLLVQPRAPGRERQALAGLAAWAYQFSPRIAFDPHCLLLEIGASLRLFGGEARLLARLERELPRLGYRAQLASAPTPAAAALLARVRPGSRVSGVAELRDRLQEIALYRFTRSRAARELLAGVGLSTLGECLQLPRPELARRLGPALGDALDRLLGLAPDPRPLWQPPPVFEERLELLGELTAAPALVFPARRLLLALCGFLHGHGGGTQQLDWRLTHRDAPDSRFRLGLLAPSRDPQQLLELLRERSERLCLAAPVVAITLRVDAWQPYTEACGELFAASRPVAADLLERLQARLGAAAVQGLLVVPDPRPERAWQLGAPGGAPPGRGPGTGGQGMTAPRPLWLLEQPRPLRVEEGCPSYGGPLRLEQPAERIEAGWWDGADVARDYYLAHSPAGERLWVYRDRRAGGWYLHGLFD